MLTMAQQRVIDILGEIGPCSLKSIMLESKGEFECRKKLVNVIEQLSNLGQTYKLHNGYFNLKPSSVSTRDKTKPKAKPKSKAKTKAPAANTATQKNKIPTATARHAVELLDGSAPQRETQRCPKQALSELEEKLNAASRPVIEDYQTKMDTLIALSNLLDPTIGDVLSAVAADLSACQ